MRALPPLLVALLLPLAGCVVEEDPDAGGGSETDGPTGTPTTRPPGGGQGFAPQQGTVRNATHGIELVAVWEACEEGFCANVTATNKGTSAVQVSSICESPWTDRMRRDGEEVRHREAMAMCAAYGRRPFAPGETMQADFTWDVRLWDDAGKSQAAPQGAYTWTLALWWDDAQGGPRKESPVDIQLIVGET